MERDRTKTENKLLRKKISAYFEPSFLICTVVMVLACSFMSMAIDGFASFVRKEPWPLKNSLDLLEEEALLPYKVVSKSKIMNPRIVQELGTEEYIEWLLEDTNSLPESPVRFCSLFITYYPMPDRVPHVPDECYVGVGFQRLTGKNIQLSVDLDGTIEDLPARFVVFSGSGKNHWSSKKFQVLYLFRVNDQYCGNRESARIALDKNIFGNHSYFSKVEWKFFNKKFGLETYPEIDEVMGASEKFLSAILPILEKDHWDNLANAKKSNE